MPTSVSVDTHSQQYLLKILEIPGKSVTQTYIDVIKTRLDELQLTYSIDIIIDDNMMQNQHGRPLQQQGGGVTYPYSTFEAAINSVMPVRKSEQSLITSCPNESTKSMPAFRLPKTALKV